MKEDITPRNNKHQEHGFWCFYNYNNELSFKGQYVNGIIHGYWIQNWIDKPEITFHIK